MLFLLFIFLQINLYSLSPSDTIWKKTLEYITKGRIKVPEGRNFFVFDESNYTSLDINSDKMKILYQKQNELFAKYGIPNYIFAVDNHNENSELLTVATHNLAAHLNTEFGIDKNKAIIGYLSIQTRRIKIRTGETIRKNITDLDAENMINNLKSYLQKENYYEAWIKFINDINYYRDDIKSNNSNYIIKPRSSSKKFKTIYIVLIIIGSIFGLVLVIFICYICSKKFGFGNYYFSNAPYATNTAYTANNSYSLNNMNISDISTFLKNNRDNKNIFIDYCVLCLEKFGNTDPHNITTYICGHIFHNKCISKLKILGCPICRHRLNPKYNQENSRIIWGIQQENNDEFKKYDFNQNFILNKIENKNAVENKDAISINKNKDYKETILNVSRHSYSNRGNKEIYHTKSYGNNDVVDDLESGGGDDCDSGGGDDGCSGGSGGADGDW
mgnify:CR=1 FL=1